ncbi:MAG TPA: hypothetical protein VE134_01845, partial [Methanomicrobiales archaeon]|nr:hypothetical protein [Methanomicrobiales archaeon]
IQNLSESEKEYRSTYVAKRERITTMRTQYQENLAKIKPVYAYVRDHLYDAPGVRWKIESSGVLDIHYY